MSANCFSFWRLCLSHTPYRGALPLDPTGDFHPPNPMGYSPQMKIVDATTGVAVYCIIFSVIFVLIYCLVLVFQLFFRFSFVIVFIIFSFSF